MSAALNALVDAPTALTATVEATAHLTAEEATTIWCIAGTKFAGLAHAEFLLRGWLGPDWLIHRGGHHVAVHRHTGDDRRVLLVR